MLDMVNKQQAEAAAPPADLHIRSIHSEQGEINTSPDNPEVALATQMGLSLRDGFRNPGCQPTATGQGTLSPQPMTRHGKRSELEARVFKSKENHNL